MKNKIITILLSSRLESLSLSLLPIVIASVLAYFYDKESFSYILLLSTSITAALLQIISNLANDYGDFQKGADINMSGEKRAIHLGVVSQQEQKQAINLLAIITFISGCLTVFLSNLNLFLTLSFIAAGIFCIHTALKYTIGSNAYGYRGLGDIFVFICFGIIAVCGTFFLQTKTLNLNVFIVSIAFGSLITAVLNINNLRDFDEDKKVDKITLAIKLGKQKAIYYHCLLYAIAFLCFIFLSFHLKTSVLLASFASILSFRQMQEIFHNNSSRALISQFEKTVQITLISGVLLIIAILF